MVGDGRRTGGVGAGGDGGGLPGTARVMSHDFNLASIVLEVQALGLWSPTVRPVLTLPGVVRPSTPKKTDYEP